MSDKSNVQNLHITKWQILHKSKRAAKVVSWTLFLVAVIAVPIILSGLEDKSVESGSNKIITLLIACPLCALSIMKIYIHASVVMRVLYGKYKIVVSKVLSIDFVNKYSKSWVQSDRVIKFSNGKDLVIDYFTSAKFFVGDDVVLIFVNNNESPIIIERKKSFDVHNNGAERKRINGK